MSKDADFTPSLVCWLFSVYFVLRVRADLGFHPTRDIGRNRGGY
jgi:hypothetical protein